MHGLESWVSRLEGAFEQLPQLFTGVDARMDGIERRLDGIERRMGGLEAALRSGQQWLGGLMFGTWVTLIAAIVLTRH